MLRRPPALPLRVHSTQKQCQSRRNSSTPPTQTDHKASAQLYSDAQLEEESNDASKPSSSRLSQLISQQQHPNWTGDESIQDAVLRMLVDKYKPLRGEFQSADEKLRSAPPKVHVETLSPQSRTSSKDVQKADGTANANSILPGDPNHKPWLVTFKPPSHVMSVKRGTIPPYIPSPSLTPPTSPSVTDKDKTTKAARDRSAKRRHEQAQRLTRAREETLDYRLGIREGVNGIEGRTARGGSGRSNPVAMKGWASLVEERIEVCWLPMLTDN